MWYCWSNKSKHQVPFRLWAELAGCQLRLAGGRFWSSDSSTYLMISRCFCTISTTPEITCSATEAATIGGNPVRMSKETYIWSRSEGWSDYCEKFSTWTTSGIVPFAPGWDIASAYLQQRVQSIEYCIELRQKAKRRDARKQSAYIQISWTNANKGTWKSYHSSSIYWGVWQATLTIVSRRNTDAGSYGTE